MSNKVRRRIVGFIRTTILITASMNTRGYRSSHQETANGMDQWQSKGEQRAHWNFQGWPFRLLVISASFLFSSSHKMCTSSYSHVLTSLWSLMSPEMISRRRMVFRCGSCVMQLKSTVCSVSKRTRDPKKTVC